MNKYAQCHNFICLVINEIYVPTTVKYVYLIKKNFGIFLQIFIFF